MNRVGLYSRKRPSESLPPKTALQGGSGHPVFFLNVPTQRNAPRQFTRLVAISTRVGFLIPTGMETRPDPKVKSTRDNFIRATARDTAPTENSEMASTHKQKGGATHIQEVPAQASTQATVLIRNRRGKVLHPDWFEASCPLGRVSSSLFRRALPRLVNIGRPLRQFISALCSRVLSVQSGL